MDKKNRKYFPIFVDLSDKKVVVVGAGTIAKRRVRALVGFTGHLFVIAPKINPELRELEEAGKLTILRKKYEREDVSDASIVIAATNDRRLNQEIYAACKEMGIPVNVFNDRTRCDFYFPVLACDDTIVAGISSGGRDSAGSRRIADQIRELLGEPEKREKFSDKETPDPLKAQADIPPDVRFVRIYTDGAARGNPDGPGGYGVLLTYRDASGLTHELEFSQGYVKTTNNRMELMAAIVGLEALNHPCEVQLYSDSQYLVHAFNQHWLDNWIKNDWKRGKNETVKNIDLWKRLLAAAAPHQISWNWVKGHDGHPENERCDALATGAADGENRIEDVVL